jgi:hypothetical protein
MQEEKMWQDRLQASMKQAEEHRLATLASNRKLGAVQAELTETREKLAAETKRSEQLSTSVSQMQQDLQSMTAARDEKAEQLEQERSTCAALNCQLAAVASKHQNDLKAAGDEEAKQARQVSLSCTCNVCQCVCFWRFVCDAGSSIDVVFMYSAQRADCCT